MNFKIYFHLWNRGGPNFQLEYKLWLHEQASEWVEVLKSNSKQTPLSGANLIPIGSDRVRRGQPGRVHHGQPAFNSKIQKPFYQVRQTVFNRLQWLAATKTFIPESKGILGPVPSSMQKISKPLNYGPIHQGQRGQSNQGPACHACDQSGNHSRGCCLAPQSQHLPSTPASDTAPTTGDQCPPLLLFGGPATSYKTAHFSSFSDYSVWCLGLSPPPLLTFSWSQTWKITAPDFDDSLPSPPATASPPATLCDRSISFASFGEYARVPLGIHQPSPTVHVAWVLKTPFTVASFPPNHP